MTTYTSNMNSRLGKVSGSKIEYEEKPRMNCAVIFLGLVALAALAGAIYLTF